MNNIVSFGLFRGEIIKSVGLFKVMRVVRLFIYVHAKYIKASLNVSIAGHSCSAIQVKKFHLSPTSDSCIAAGL